MTQLNEHGWWRKRIKEIEDVVIELKALLQKQQPMTQLKPFDDLFAVPIPNGAKNITIIQSHSYFNSPRLEHSIGGVDLPTDGNWQPLFTTESATEQDWAGVIPGKYDDILAMTGEEAVWYHDYENPILSINMALESGHSLMAANGLEGNYAIVKQVK